MQKKINFYRGMLSDNLNLLLCPICGGNFFLDNGYSLRCENKHCFDISAKGCLNFAPAAKRVYAKILFENRREVFSSGFFNPMLDMLCDLANGRKTILDAGCGEGSALQRVADGINAELGIGIDIARDGVAMATDYRRCLWFTADLAHLPLNGGSMDAIFNILSPANYDEFKRVLKKDGVLLKVIPNSGYLRELREFFYQNEPKEKSGIRDLFQSRFDTSYHEVKYTFSCERLLLEKIVAMTPLCWHVPEDKRENFLRQAPLDITVELEILVGS